MKLIILGAPGAGKGTQAEIISDRYHIPIIGTGNLIREAIKSGSPLGQEIQKYVDAGQLVPDEVVVEMLKERMAEPDAKDGYILDGFPRNVAQAQTLEDMNIEVDSVINLDVSDDDIITRMSGRRVCGKCGSSYHIEFKKPKVEGICDRDGEKLIIRDDDKPEVVKQRLDVYHEQTAPLADFYSQQNKLVTIPGTGTVEDITNLITKELDE